MVFSALIRVSTSSVIAPLSNPPRAARASVGMLFRYFAPRPASGEKPMQPRPGPQRVQQAVFDPAVEHRIVRLVNEQRHALLAQKGGGLARHFFGRIAGDADIQRLALPVQMGKRGHWVSSSGVSGSTRCE